MPSSVASVFGRHYLWVYPECMLVAAYTISAIGNHLPATLILSYVQYVLQSDLADFFLPQFFFPFRDIDPARADAVCADIGSQTEGQGVGERDGGGGIFQECVFKFR